MSSCKLTKFVAIGKHFNQFLFNWLKRKEFVQFTQAFTNYYKNPGYTKMPSRTITNVLISGRFCQHIALFI